MINKLEQLFDKIPTLQLSLHSTRVVITYALVYIVLDLVQSIVGLFL